MTTRAVGDLSRALKHHIGRCLLCDRCLPPSKLEWAHVEPTGMCGRGRGTQGRFYDLLKYPRCYVLACRHCHSRIDMTRVGREALLTPARREAAYLAFEEARGKVCPTVGRRAQARKEAA